jgi:hypothetical protein
MIIKWTFPKNFPIKDQTVKVEPIVTCPALSIKQTNKLFKYTLMKEQINIFKLINQIKS